MLDIVILHQVFGQKLVVGPYTIEIDVAVHTFLTLQGEMHHHIITQPVVLDIVAVADIKSTIGILVIEIVTAWLIGEDKGVKKISVPSHAVYTQSGMVGSQHLKLMVFVAGGEDQVAAMLPFQPVVHGVLGRSIHDGVVPAAVLHHHCFDLSRRVDDGHAAVVH